MTLANLPTVLPKGIVNNIWRTDPPNHLLQRVRHNVALGPMTWLKTGGYADAFFKPSSVEELQCILHHLHPDTPLHIIGAGSNLLIRDGGLRGLTIRLGKEFATITSHAESITAGATTLLPDLALQAAQSSQSGLEFYIGIPGTVGGAIAMNAGAHNKTTADIFVECTTLDRAGTQHVHTAENLVFLHRYCSIPAHHIIISATFKTFPAVPDVCRANLKQYIQYRDDTQPKNVATCGCVFKNPSNHKAWQLVQNCNVDLYSGRAQISKKHANFLINAQTASAQDLENLIIRIEDSVFNQTGIRLERELRIIGEVRHDL